MLWMRCFFPEPWAEPRLVGRQDTDCCVYPSSEFQLRRAYSNWPVLPGGHSGSLT